MSMSSKDNVSETSTYNEQLFGLTHRLIHRDAPGNRPYLGIRYQIFYHTCNLSCPYCIARWKTHASRFDAATYYRILDKIRELPYEVCLRIGIGGEIFTSHEILEGVRRICNEDNNIFGVNFSSNIYADVARLVFFNPLYL